MPNPPTAGRCFLLRRMVGPSPDECFALAPGQQLRFGRYPPEVDVLLAHPTIGRRHFVVTNEGGACVLEHVPGLKPQRPRVELVRQGAREHLAAEGRHRVEIGDILCIADSTFRLEESPARPPGGESMA
jgi:hypothetical protein